MADKKPSPEMQKLLDKRSELELSDAPFVGAATFKEIRAKCEGLGSEEATALKVAWDKEIEVCHEWIRKKEVEIEREIWILDHKEEGIPIYLPADSNEAAVEMRNYVNKIMRPVLTECITIRSSRSLLDALPPKEYAKISALVDFASKLKSEALKIAQEHGYSFLLH